MTEEEMVNRNLELHYHLMMQLLREPDSLDIPDGSEVIFLPEDDESLAKANLRLGRRSEKSGKRVVYVKIKFVPETRTVMTPKLTMLHSG